MAAVQAAAARKDEEESAKKSVKTAGGWAASWAGGQDARTSVAISSRPGIFEVRRCVTRTEEASVCCEHKQAQNNTAISRDIRELHV